MVSTAELDYVEYEIRDGVGIWTMTDFAAHFESGEQVEKGEQHYRERATDDSMDATIIVIENARDLGGEIRESLDHINEEWSKLADAVDIDRLAYVADGMMARTVKMNVEAEIETESFESLDEAVDWCRRA